MTTARKLKLESVLPEPPANKTGWPWDVPMPRLPERMADGSPWPKITLVTPNHNYGHFIEKTIRSVLLQGYPNLEFLIHDDGSTDNSRDVILKYKDFLTFRPDENHGQSYQIAKGLASGTGEIFNWLNSDDYLLPGALKKVAEAWRRDKPDLMVGTTVQTDENGKELCVFKPLPPRAPFDFFIDHAVCLPQPSVFLSAKVLKQAGGIRTDLRYFMDWELYFRLYATPGSTLKACPIHETLAHAVLHPQAKTASYGKILEKEFLSLLKEQNNHPDQKLRRVINQQFKLRTTKSVLTEFGQNGPVTTREFFRQFADCPRLLLTRFGCGALKNGSRTVAKRTWVHAKRTYLNTVHQLPETSLNELLDGRKANVLEPILEDICLNPYMGFNNLDDYTPLMTTAAVVKPKVILEFGTAFGNTVANLLRHSPNSQLYTVNALPENHTMEAFKLAQNEIGRVYKKNGLERQVTLILENTLNIDLSAHLKGKTIDLAIIDACHETDFVLNDFKKVYPHMSPGGIIFLHDTHPSGDAHLSGSLTACQMLRARGFKIFHLQNSWWGVWRKGK